jgi:ABC-2 type transport system permease protein
MTATVAAFVRRDALIWVSYRMAIVWEFLWVIALVTVVYLVGGLLEGSPAFIAQYNTTYVGFLMTSVIFVDAWSVGFLLPGVLRQNQSLGVLEAMMLSRYGIFRLLALSAAFPVLMKLCRLSAFAAFSVTVLGLWRSADIVAAAVVCLVTMATTMTLGILSAAFVLVLKQGDPVIALYGLANGLLAGVFFPREVMPAWLQAISLALPFTHGLDAIRIVLQGGDLRQVIPQLLVLSGMFAILLPLTAWTLRWAERRAKEEGSLVQY